MNVAVWHKTDLKDKVLRVCVCEIYSVADVSVCMWGGVVFCFFFIIYLLVCVFGCILSSEASRGPRGVTRFALAASF